MWVIVVIVLVGTAATLLHLGRAKSAWIVPVALFLVWWAVKGGWGTAPFHVIAVVFGLAALVLGIPALRARIVTRQLMKSMAGFLPQMSETERTALQAGTVWWDGDLFSGSPDWKKWLLYPPAQLSAEEQAFLDGPIEELCKIGDDWEMSRRGDLAPAAWDLIRRKRLFSLIIPKEFGGYDFSAQMNSAVVAKLSSRSPALAVTVMIPNSVGPAELLRHYGTEEQKRYYLPRLASCEEIPCFALSEPNAGSDAGGLQSYGVVCRSRWEGQEIIGIRLSWNKRYITLGPVATILGLAFRLHDPEHLIGEREDLGITVGLIPAHLPGIVRHRRHDPLGAPFLNGPTTGKDVFVPLDVIIGGPAMAGKGWMMLMQCLSAGRGISLPSLSAGAAKLSTRAAGAYASVRQQFGVPVGSFEGVQEVLSRVAGLTYTIDAVRSVTAASIDLGEKPSVISAISKAYTTEAMRRVVTEALDVFGGAGVSLGPKNILGNTYRQLPIEVTVEGHNILTRTMIIFGQGVLRCHPYAQHEVLALAEGDARGLDRALFAHIGFMLKNAMRAKVLAITDGRGGRPPLSGPMAIYFGRLNRFCAAFALVADVAMVTLGGSLKRRERLTGRLSDVFSWLYLASCVLKRYVDEGQTERDLPCARWAMEYALHEVQEALRGVVDNLPSRPAAWALRSVIFGLGHRYRPPSDELGTAVAQGILEDGELRRHLTTGMFVPPAGEPGLGQLEDALQKAVAARPVQKKIVNAVRHKVIARRPLGTLVARAVQAAVITEDERRIVEAADAARAVAIAVDEFESIGNALPATGRLRGERTETPATSQLA